MIRHVIDFILYYELVTVACIIIPWALGVSIIFLRVVYIYFDWLWEGMEEENRFYWIKMGKW